MDKGDRAKALGAAATTSFGTAFSDPTGASVITFLTADAGFAIGSAYHLSRGSVKRILENMAYNHQGKATANIFNLSPALYIDTQEMVEDHTSKREASREPMLTEYLGKTSSQLLCSEPQSWEHCSA